MRYSGLLLAVLAVGGVSAQDLVLKREGGTYIVGTQEGRVVTAEAFTSSFTQVDGVYVWSTPDGETYYSNGVPPTYGEAVAENVLSLFSVDGEVDLDNQLEPVFRTREEAEAAAEAEWAQQPEEYRGSELPPEVPAVVLRGYEDEEGSYQGFFKMTQDLDNGKMITPEAWERYKPFLRVVKLVPSDSMAITYYQEGNPPEAGETADYFRRSFPEGDYFVSAGFTGRADDLFGEWVYALPLSAFTPPGCAPSMSTEGECGAWRRWLQQNGFQRFAEASIEKGKGWIGEGLSLVGFE